VDRRAWLAFVLGLLVAGGPLTTYAYTLNGQVLALENEIGLRDQQLAGLQGQVDSLMEDVAMLEEQNAGLQGQVDTLNETVTGLQEAVARLQAEIDTLNGTEGNGEGPGGLPFNFTSEWKNFTFTWGPDTQKVVQGTLRIEISLRWGIRKAGGLESEYLYCLVKVNDKEYNPHTYLGLVFDTNGNGVIDSNDKSYIFFADNTTVLSFLHEDGFLLIADVPRTPMLLCNFDPNTGYTFDREFGKDELNLPDPSVIPTPLTPLHVCFENPYGRVFVRFTFVP